MIKLYLRIMGIQNQTNMNPVLVIIVRRKIGMRLYRKILQFV